MSKQNIYLLGGYQSDFSRNVLRDGGSLAELFVDTVRSGLQSCQLDPADVQVGHVGNFVATLFTGQAQLGGFFGHVDPAMANMPAIIERIFVLDIIRKITFLLGLFERG